jgi:hypothetical protein
MPAPATRVGAVVVEANWADEIEGAFTKTSLSRRPASDPFARRSIELLRNMRQMTL